MEKHFRMTTAYGTLLTLVVNYDCDEPLVSLLSVHAGERTLVTGVVLLPSELPALIKALTEARALTAGTGEEE